MVFRIRTNQPNPPQPPRENQPVLINGLPVNSPVLIRENAVIVRRPN